MAGITLFVFRSINHSSRDGVNPCKPRMSGGILNSKKLGVLHPGG